MTQRASPERILAKRREQARERQKRWREKHSGWSKNQNDVARRRTLKEVVERLSKLEREVYELKEFVRQ